MGALKSTHEKANLAEDGISMDTFLNFPPTAFWLHIETAYGEKIEEKIAKVERNHNLFNA